MRAARGWCAPSAETAELFRELSEEIAARIENAKPPFMERPTGDRWRGYRADLSYRDEAHGTHMPCTACVDQRCEDTNASYTCDHCGKDMPSDWEPYAHAVGDDV